MDDLPLPSVPSANQDPPQDAVGSMAKESLPPATAETPAIREVGQEMPLPSEVAKAGVKVKPTTVVLPKPVQQMGVNAVGDTVTPPPAAAPLPLTDDQIAQGLHTGLSSSLRWLAEWCVRRLKQVHQSLKSLHGKVMRVSS